MSILADGEQWRVIEGDCLEVLKSLPDGCVDAVVTDPPYGVDLGNHKNREGVKNGRGIYRSGYESYEDTQENFAHKVVPAISRSLELSSGVGAVFCPFPSASLLPSPACVGGIFLPAGCGRNPWGFSNFAHCLFYGTSRTNRFGCRPTGIASSSPGPGDVDHPCPKPLDWMVWLVQLATRPGDLILDPFCGSGTTGVACIQTGRRFIGLEIEPKYAAIARRRISEAAPLFVRPPEPDPELFGAKP